MADKKISALTGASTPLAGTEVLPIVQGGATVKVSVDNLTAGKTVNMKELVASSAGRIASFSRSAISGLDFYADNTGILMVPTTKGTIQIYNMALTQQIFALDTVTGSIVNQTGNYVPATAAKGINFTANTPAAGMTSQLLNWYEEGTWTPNQGSALTVVGTFSSGGNYVRVGNLVHVTGVVSGSTSVAITSINNICTNLPFTVKAGASSIGAVTSPATLLTFTGCYANNTTTSLLSINTVGATSSIEFSVSYQI